MPLSGIFAGCILAALLRPLPDLLRTQTLDAGILRRVPSVASPPIVDSHRSSWYTWSH